MISESGSKFDLFFYDGRAVYAILKVLDRFGWGEYSWWVRMKRWFASFLVIFALAGGVLSGMPMHEEKAGMMNCCPKAKHRDSSTKVTMARLCCALNCTDPAPVSSAFSVNLAVGSINVTDSIRRQIAEMFAAGGRELPASSNYETRAFAPSSSPKYLQHHSFRI